jgi:glucose-6-phosphate 1-dehydrogenase
MDDTGAVSQPSRIVILGITGDLARRYRVPALAALEASGTLPEGVDVVGVGRSRPRTGCARSSPT